MIVSAARRHRAQGRRRPPEHQGQPAAPGGHDGGHQISRGGNVRDQKAAAGRPGVSNLDNGTDADGEHGKLNGKGRLAEAAAGLGNDDDGIYQINHCNNQVLDGQKEGRS